MKVLLIEDDREIIQLLSMTFRLRWPDCSVVSAGKGIEGVGLTETESPDVVILEINLPDIDGFQVLNRIRLFSDVPVVILTERGDEIDRVRGLEAGADDYIVKPFSHLELLARVKSALRRTEGVSLNGNGMPFVCGDLMVNFDSSEVFFKGDPVHLTPTEFRLLYHLVRRGDRFVTTGAIQQWLWGQSGAVDSSVIRRYIYQLRCKFKDIPPRLIVSEVGKGYKFVLHKTSGAVVPARAADVSLTVS